MARYYKGKAPSFRLIDRTTLPRVFAQLAVSDLSAPALTWYENDERSLHINYGELLEQVKLMAHWLVFGCGARRGDRLVVISANCPEAFVAHLATMSIGAISVPVNNGESERVLGLVVELVSPRAVLLDETWRRICAFCPGARISGCLDYRCYKPKTFRVHGAGPVKKSVLTIPL